MFETIKNIKPAVLFKDEIEREIMNRMYSKEMHFMSGRIGTVWVPDLELYPDNYNFQFAILDNNDMLIGYIGFRIDYVMSCAQNFGLFSFEPGNIIVGRVTNDIIRECYKFFHRVEWRAQGDNATLHNYIKMCKKLGGDYFVLHDVDKNERGEYIDSYIFEVINDESIYK